jgi:hypothetical protein
MRGFGLTLAGWADVGQAIGGIAAALALLFIWFQLRAAEKAQKAAMKAETERRTLDACRSFHTDPTLFEIKRKMFEARHADDPAKGVWKIRREVVNYLNFIESLCIGIEQGIYDEQIVFDNLSIHVLGAVEYFIDRHPISNPNGDLVVRSDFHPLLRVQQRFAQLELGLRSPTTYRADGQRADRRETTGERS